jgi:hypothetical protein
MSEAADIRYRERWHTNPSPHSNTVHHMQVRGEPSGRPDSPCFLCGARDDGSHRVFA